MSTARMLDGRNVTCRQLAVEQPWVAVCVNYMARQIARLPWKVYRRDGDAGRVRDRDSPAAQRLRRPDVRRTQTQLKFEAAVGLLVDGNHLERMVTCADGRPGLRALDWRWVVPYILDGDVVLWEYRPPNTDPVLLDPSEVIHYRWAGYRPGPLGVSPLEHLGVTLRNEDAAQRWGESNFRNGTRVGFAAILQKDGSQKQTPEVVEQLREQIVARYAGPENAGRPIVLGSGVADIKPIESQTPVEAALIDQRKLNREEVMAVYGLPPTIAGDLEHGTYSNVTEQGEALFRTVLPPWLELLQTETTVQMIGNPDPGEHYTEFDLNDVTRGDITKRMAAYQTAINAGVLTLNDVRDLENRPRFVEAAADEPLVMANNLVPLSMLTAPEPLDGPQDQGS